MNKIERDSYTYNYNSDTNKYHIDCEKFKKDPDKYIINEHIIKNKSDITVFKSVIDKVISAKHKHIVLKIGKINKTIEKEFYIGHLLETNNIPGFIHYMCLFQCYDNTYQLLENKKYDIKNLHICTAKPDNDIIKSILVMPFIQEDSIKNYKWNNDKYNILKSVIQQSILSIFMAYHKLGFIHNDLHLDNILLKKTKKDVITYQTDIFNYNIKSYGYKVIIMDFDSSFVNIDKNVGNQTYWHNLLNMISRLQTDLKTIDEDRINILNFSKIISFIEKNLQNNISYLKTSRLVDMFNDITITTIKLPQFIYNPNVF